ncbi:MAG: SRPBCC domain-containing protein [Bacteroidetes bacterium]|nr:SRPBCC domain-containing protein [Bacteroidota bacterium]
MELKPTITVKTTVQVSPEKAWEIWTTPQHIMQWNHASEDWHTPAAENDVRKDGKFSFTMAAKDGSFSFDFAGVYTKVEKNKHLAYAMADGREVSVDFLGDTNQTEIIETFEAENENSIELQQQGWQNILDNFKKHCESLS